MRRLPRTASPSLSSFSSVTSDASDEMDDPVRGVLGRGTTSSRLCSRFLGELSASGGGGRRRTDEKATDVGDAEGGRVATAAAIVGGEDGGGDVAANVNVGGWDDDDVGGVGGSGGFVRRLPADEGGGRTRAEVSWRSVVDALPLVLISLCPASSIPSARSITPGEWNET